MTGIIMPRRKFLVGLVGLVAAPMVVKASSLMPVRTFENSLLIVDISWDAYCGEYKRILGLQLTGHRAYLSPELVQMYRQNPMIATIMDNAEAWRG
ncbi:MAG: hypothetical protein ABSG83_19875 [Roseiarcus sp.]